ncbi:ComEC/Rec2 family competence protein [Mycoplasma corogypsi]|uniref:ComEC/Rec2 family competence protein n=1 Tax=Mycoplasma corogypsi TaxID=2106 RepID=UPI0038738B6F
MKSDKYKPLYVTFKVHQAILCIGFLAMIKDPLTTLNYGYWITYLLSFALLEWNNTTKFTISKTRWKKLVIWVHIWMVSMSIVLTQAKPFSAISLFFNLVFSFVIEFYLMIFTFAYPIGFIVKPAAYTLQKLINYSQEINIRLIVDFEPIAPFLLFLIYTFICYPYFDFKKHKFIDYYQINQNMRVIQRL